MRNIRLLAQAMRHPLGRRARLRTLGRIAAWQVRCRLRRVVATEWVNGTTLIAARRESGATGNIYFGLMEPFDMGFLGHLLRPGDCFVDGGANVGAYAILAASLGAKVHAFEPAAETLPRLRENAAANPGEIAIHACALGDQEGEACFTAGRDSENALSEMGETVVRVARLDSFALAPTAIKLDLEGGEEAALAGARTTLAAPGLLAVLAETVSPASRDMLTQAGLVRRWYDPFERRLSPEPPGRPSNQLWIRDEAEVTSRLQSAPPLRLAGRDLFG